MKLKDIKLELFYLRKSRRKKELSAYVYNKFIFGRRILQAEKPMDKPVNRNDFSVHTLTCHRDMVMFLWALASFYAASETIGQVYVHNDGSFEDNDRKLVKRLFPSVKIVEPNDIFLHCGDKLAKYPVIEKFRKEMPDFVYFKKSIDPYFVSDKKYLMVIDNDIVWLRNADEIYSQIGQDNPKSFMTVDADNWPIHFKDGTAFGAGYNSGIDFYARENYDPEKYSEFLLKVDLDHPSKHYMEQAGFAYLLKNLELLPEEKYIIKRKIVPETVCKHYTGPRRQRFFTEGLPLVKSKILL